MGGACGVFAYATFSIIAGCLGDYRKLPNLVVMVTGIISIIQVIFQLLFIQDVSRRRIHTADQDRSKPGRQIVTFLLICNLAIWVIYTFEVQKVEESPVQIEFLGDHTEIGSSTMHLLQIPQHCCIGRNMEKYLQN